MRSFSEMATKIQENKMTNLPINYTVVNPVRITVYRTCALSEADGETFATNDEAFKRVREFFPDVHIVVEGNGFLVYETSDISELSLAAIHRG